MNVLQKYKVRVLQLQNVAVLHLHSKIFANDFFVSKVTTVTFETKKSAVSQMTISYQLSYIKLVFQISLL